MSKIFGKRKASQKSDVITLIDQNTSSGKYGSVSSASKSAPDTHTNRQNTNVGIFSFSERHDYVLMIVGTFASFVHGAGFPFLSVILGGMTTVFLRAQNSPFVTGKPWNYTNHSAGDLLPMSKEEFNYEVITYAVYYLILGITMFLTSYIQIACWESVAERVVFKLRDNYLYSILRQEIAWFDTKQTGNLTSRLTDDLERVREGLGDKLSLFIQMVSAFISGFAIGFIYNWQMTLVMIAFTPILVLTNAWMARISASRTVVEQQKYAIAGGIVEETLSSMRTIHSLNAHQHEIRRFDAALTESKKTGLVKYLYMGMGVGLGILTTYLSYAVAFYYGSLLIGWNPKLDRGSIFTVFFAVMNGSTALGGALPHLASVSMAFGAARLVLSVISNIPHIDPYSDEGIVPSKIKGAIEIENVHFRYPSRPSVKILNGISIKIKAGEKIALVGSSGCGKSTIIGLLMRFYDPEAGTIKLDGRDVRELNVRALRESIGIVSQEPILFDGTVEENVMLGNEMASREDVIKCLKMANAHDFVTKLPDGLYTRVGERGTQLSGGQKQRIAIARALIRNPKILLLDEATSALDTESERVVQEALERAQHGRTTITVAHRLATIKDVNRIFVFKDGEIVESGTHNDLISTHGLYYSMVNVQQLQMMEDSQLAVISEEKVKNGEEDVHSTEGSNVESRSARGSSKKQSSVTRRHYKSNDAYSDTQSQVSQVQTYISMREDFEENRAKTVPVGKIFKKNSQSMYYLLMGMVGCLINGSIMPFFAVIYAEIVQVFSEPVSQMQTDALFWSLMFVTLGIVACCGFFISAQMLGICGEELTKKLRYEAFVNLLRQDIAFYDDDRHQTGKLCTRFATDAPNVRYVFTRLPVVVSSIVTIVGATIIGFSTGWQLALILLLILPLIIASGYFEMAMKYGKAVADTALLEEAGRIASEAVDNIRTVHGINRQNVFHEKYIHYLQEPHHAAMHHAHIYGGVFAFSQSIIFFMYAVAFYVGALFVNDNIMMPIDVYRIFFAFAFCGQAVGQVSSFIPDVVKSRLAAALIFHLIEFPTIIDNLSSLGIQTTLKGGLEFRNIHYAYPTRPNIRILRNFSLQIQQGQNVALVGYSGCGKSTIMALLERFYDPLKGNILIDGINIRDINIKTLREQVCIVSQEPTLFDCTIEENITYGTERNVPHDEVVAVAEEANIHKFILGLPNGYQTRVGARGTQLSGGQKQRLAIARALIRNPKILLLDEATSALDTESERVVQEALERASRGRTSIVIAHRLSTVQNADSIIVINNGQVAEQGRHEELYTRNGIYRQLCDSQLIGAIEAASDKED